MVSARHPNNRSFVQLSQVEPPNRRPTMDICLSEATTMPAPFAEDVAACAAGGFAGLEVWLTKLEQHLAAHSADDTRRLLDEKGVRLAAAAYQGGLLLSQGPQRKAHFDDYRKRLELCQGFGIGTLL